MVISHGMFGVGHWHATTLLSFLHTWSMLRDEVGWGGVGDGDVPWTCTSGWCYAMDGFLGVGLGGVKFLHFEGKITSVVHSHPPSHYICKHAPGWVLVMFTIHRMQNKTECLRFHVATLQCANAKNNFMQFHCISLVWNWTAVVFGTALSCFSVWRTSPPPSLQQACCSPPLTSQPFGAEWHAFWRSVNHITLHHLSSPERPATLRLLTTPLSGFF